MSNLNKENQITSPSELDQVIQHTSTRSWLLIITLLISITAALTWAFFGEIPLIVEANGILIHEDGLRTIQAPEAGIIKKLHVKPNQHIKKGNLIANISLPLLVEKIEEKKALIELLKSHRKRTKKLKTSERWIKQEEILFQITKERNKLSKLRARYKSNSKIMAEYPGYITDIMVSDGDYIKLNDSIINIEPLLNKNPKMLAIMYLHPSKANKIKPGLETNIALQTFEPELFGLLKGKTITLSEYPETKQGMMRTLRNNTLVDSLINSGRTTELRIGLIPDINTVTGYSWTSNKGPSTKLKSGSTCKGSIILSKIKPIKLIIPLLKDLLLD
jgi:biotin carboxyl carrier protein